MVPIGATPSLKRSASCDVPLGDRARTAATLPLVKRQRDSSSFRKVCAPDQELMAASTRVFNVPEIRSAIYKLVDKRSLCNLMRLSREALAGAAEILYSRIGGELSERINRDTERGRLYSNCVRHLDLSPLFIDDRISSPSYFDFDQVAQSRAKHPYLLSITYKDPSQRLSDAYMVHLDDESISVEIVSKPLIAVYGPPPQSCNIQFPRDYTVPELSVRHTFHVQLVYHSDDALNSCLDMEDDYEHLAHWSEWLFRNSLADPRITSIEDLETACSGGPPIVTMKDILSWMTHRNLVGLPPLSYFSLPEVTYLHRPATLSSSIGPQITSLSVDASLSNPEDPQDMISIIDTSFPRLEVLIIRGYYLLVGDIADLPALSGLPHLRRLVIEHMPWNDRDSGAIEYYRPKLLRHLTGIGNNDTVVDNTAYGEARTDFDELLRMRKLLLSGGGKGTWDAEKCEAVAARVDELEGKLDDVEAKTYGYLAGMRRHDTVMKLFVNSTGTANGSRVYHSEGLWLALPPLNCFCTAL